MSWKRLTSSSSVHTYNIFVQLQPLLLLLLLSGPSFVDPATSGKHERLPRVRHGRHTGQLPHASANNRLIESNGSGGCEPAALTDSKMAMNSTNDVMTFKLAVLLPDTYRPQHSWGFSIQKVQPAIELALSQIDADSRTLIDYDSELLFNVSTDVDVERQRRRGRVRKHRFEVYYADSQCDIAAAVNEAFQMYQKPNRRPDAIIGPCCDYAMAPVARQAAYWNVPVMTAGAMAPEYATEKLTRYPGLTRIGANFNSMSDFVVELLLHFRWAKVKLLYSRRGQTDILHELCHMAITGIHSLLLSNAYRSKVHQRYYKFSDQEVDNDDNRTKLLTSEIGNNFAVIVLCANATSVRELMITAARNNFHNGDYVFFNIDLFSSKAQLERPWYRQNDTDERNELARKGFQALKTITLRKPDSKEYATFSVEVKRRAGPEVYSNEEEVNSFVGAFHDAVILYALAVNETLADNQDPRNGTEITRRMWKRSFQGITGNVTIDANGDRDVDYSLLDMNTDGRFEVVGNYFGSRHVYEPVPEKKIHWAGNRTSAPPDTPLCGFDNEKCQPFPSYGIALIVISCFSVTSLTVAFLIYRNWKLKRELAKLVIRWRDIEPINYGYDLNPNAQLAINHRPSILNLVFDDPEPQPASRQWFTNVGVFQTREIAIKPVANIEWSRKINIECKKLKDLQHDHLNRFVGICRERPCILTDYCHRGSLMDVLENDKLRLDDSFKLSLIQDVVNGMIYLHSSCIRSHGSLKSSNCVIDARFALKITDFGLPSLRSVNGYTRNFTIKGEVHPYAEYFAKLWTAPELLQADRFLVQGTQKGDVYSFAIICHEIVMRKGPFWRQREEFDPEEIYWSVREGARQGSVVRPTLIEDQNLGTELPINQLMKKCWKEEPEDRPDFHAIKSQIKNIFREAHTSGNLLDNLLNRMDKYANNLESLVEARTADYLKQKERVEDLLYQMLPRSVALEYMDKNEVQPVKYDEVTIYFSDIVGFTDLTTNSQAIQIVNMLNKLYTMFDEITLRFDVYKVETIGDAYMVVSGLPELNGKRHAVEICRMALALLREVQSFVIDHRPEKRLLLRIGIHSGEVCACVVGKKMPRYCLVGDTVNTASRMESNGKELRIHVSPVTKSILDTFGTFVLRQRKKPIKPKGLGEMYTYWLLDEVTSSAPAFSSQVSGTTVCNDMPHCNAVNGKQQQSEENQLGSSINGLTTSPNNTLIYSVNHCSPANIYNGLCTSKTASQKGSSASSLTSLS